MIDRTMRNRKWYWDFEFFNKRNPTVAYWAGFLLADGHINVNPPGVNMVVFVQPEDLHHIESFCDDLELDRSAISVRKEGYVGFQLNYKHLAEQLEPWGVVPNKTKNFCHPDIPNYLLPHFLRGWFDGDGSMYRTGSGARFVIYSGNKESVVCYSKALEFLGFGGHIGLYPNKDWPGNWRLYIGGANNVAKIVEILQGDTSFILERKWNKHYENRGEMVIHECVWCGNEFEVTKYRHENEPENGRFCSKECFDNYQRKPVVKGHKQCARCEQFVSLENWSANKSYCKPCWNEMARERRAKAKNS